MCVCVCVYFIYGLLINTVRVCMLYSTIYNVSRPVHTSTDCHNILKVQQCENKPRFTTTNILFPLFFF